MDESEVKKQLSQMVNFIIQEAQEKANEIDAKAKEEFSIEKARIVQEEKIKIIKEFTQKEKQVEVQKKIMYSNMLNQSRLKILKTREDGVQNSVKLAYERLAEIGKPGPAYQELLQKLIIQGLLKLQETTVILLYRKEDEEMVEQASKEAVKEYKKLSGKDCNLSLEKSFYLPPGPQSGGTPQECCHGGVLLSSRGSKILCTNTLDARLDQAYEQLLPQIRVELYGKNPNRAHMD
jgi:V-type H+-transporting ATPase subunit E